MIESSPFTVNLARMAIDESRYDEMADGLEDLEYSRERSYGFVIEDFEPHLISARLVITTPVKIQDYDEEKEEITDIQVDKTELIPFRVDFDKQYLEVFASSDDTSRVITRLGEAMNWDISISQSSLNLLELYDSLGTIDWDVSINSLQISNFSIDEHTTGSYRMKIFDKSQAKEYMSKYGNNIAYLGTEFSKGNEDVAIGFYKSGSIRIFSSTEEDSQLLSSIKNSLNRYDGVMKDA